MISSRGKTVFRVLLDKLISVNHRSRNAMKIEQRFNVNARPNAITAENKAVKV